MPKLKNPSVKFAFIKKKRFPFQTVRLCLTYKGKRLYQTDEGSLWYGIDLSQFNSDGTLRPNFNVPDNFKATPDDYIQLSKGLLGWGQSAIMIAEEAVKRGVWESMTSKDFSDLFSYMSEHRVVAERKKHRKLNDLEVISEKMYEWRWSRVGKGVL